METKPVVQSGESFLQQDEMITIVLNCIKRQYVASKAYDQGEVFLDMVKVAKKPELYSYCHPQAVSNLMDHVFTNDAIRNLVLNLSDSIKIALCYNGDIEPYMNFIRRISLAGIDSAPLVSGKEADDYLAMPDMFVEVAGTTQAARINTFKYNGWLVALFAISYLEVPLFSFIAEIK